MLTTECGPRGGYLVDGPAKPKRMAYMVLSRVLLEALDCASSEPRNVKRMLLLPDNCQIEAESHTSDMLHDAVVLKLSCPDFVDSLEGQHLPEVHAEYGVTVDLLGKRVSYFAGWHGAAALRGGYVPPPRPDTSRCSEKLGHFADPRYDFRCCCGQVLRDDALGQWKFVGNVVPRKPEGLYRATGAEVYPCCSAVSHFRDQDDRSRCQCGKMACVDGHWRDLKVELLKAMACPSVGQDVCDCPRVEDVAKPAACVHGVAFGDGCKDCADNYEDKPPSEEPKRSNRGYEFL